MADVKPIPQAPATNKPPATPQTKFAPEEEQQRKAAEEVKKIAEETAKKKNAEREEIMKKITVALKEYGGLEANIPLSHEYWSLLNQLRALK